MNQLNELTNKIIGSAIQVHKQLDHGLLESIYEKAFRVELELAGLSFEDQKVIKVDYKGRLIGDYIIDIVVEDSVVLELKCVEKFNPVFEAQILN